MKYRNTIAALALLPLNVLVVGYGLLAVGMSGWAHGYDGGPSPVPVRELGYALAVAGVILAGLLLARMWGAAVFQLIPVAILLVMMAGWPTNA
ncbi:hypothetical protein [Streptomyces sp. NPDC058953]|uniref:hypothetical protein n=1 Tax=unclassified Streptomyces TaxID=2593676 RepID=UPI00367A4A3B